MKNKKISKQKQIELLKMVDTLEILEKKLALKQHTKVKSSNCYDDLRLKIKDATVKVPNEKEIEEGLIEGLPSESEKYEGMSYKEVIEKALLAENEAIELNALLIELAPEKDIRKFVEILSDENDHSQIYQGVLNRINKNGE